MFKSVLLSTGVVVSVLEAVAFVRVPEAGACTALSVRVATCCMEYCFVGWEEREV